MWYTVAACAGVETAKNADNTVKVKRKHFVFIDLSFQGFSWNF
jgi:hypothetical protein